MLFQKVEDESPKIPLFGLKIECVRCIRDDHKLAFRPGLFENCCQGLTLAQGHSFVLAAMNDEHRCGVFSHVVDGRCLLVKLRRISTGFREHFHIVVVEQFYRAVEINCTTNGCGKFAVGFFRFKPIFWNGGGQHGRKIATGGTAHDSDAIRINLQPIRIFSQPAHGGLRVVNALRPGGLVPVVRF